MIRMAIAILLLLPALAIGQTTEKEKDEDKVSNDNPARPIQMPPASTEVKEAFDDFERFQRRGAWERALKALYTLPEDQVLRFIDGDNGFVIPVARKRRLVLSALSPNGQAAYRLFYDSVAQKLFEEAEGPNELKNLERIYSAYFITSIGDNAADRLGDLYFELGRFDRAADCWLAVLRERPDSDLSPALLAVKAALGLFRAGRQSEFNQVRAELGDRYSDEKITLGGQTGSPAELLRRLVGDGQLPPNVKPSKIDARSAQAGPDLKGAVDPTWQVRIADSVEAGMTPPELTQWESNPLSVALPPVAVHGSTLYANYLGHVFAVDLESGKMLWRSASFHQIEVPAMQEFARFIDCSRYAIVASDEYVWSLARDLKDQNYFAPFQLICRRADNGEVVWKSPDLPDYAPFDLVGHPILADGKLFLAGKTQANPQQRQGLPQQFVLAIQPHDGKLLWKTEIGTFRQGQSFYFYYSRDSTPQPRLVQRAGAVYIDTHVGVLGRLDAETGSLDWGFGYKTDKFRSDFFFWYYEMPEPTATVSPPVSTGEAFLVKGAQSERLYCVDPNRLKVLWERPITKAARLLGGDDHTVYFGGAELSAIDLQTRKLLWATRVAGDSMQGQVLVRRRRPLATHAPRHLRDRSQDRRRAADLPRQGSGRGGRRSVSDRKLAHRRLQSHDLGLSAPLARIAGRSARRPGAYQGEASKMNRSSTRTACIMLFLVVGRPVLAQFEPPAAAPGAPQNIEGFTVAGKGHVEAKPDKFEIDLEVAASSELTADAVVKYRDAKRRIHEAFTALKLANVAIEERGLLVDQKGAMQNPYFFGYEPTTRAKTEVQLTRKLVVKASDIRKMDEEAVLQLVGRLLDVSQDAGAKVGGGGENRPYYYYRYNQPSSSGLVRFVLDDFDRLIEEAYEKAIADARARFAAGTTRRSRARPDRGDPGDLCSRRGQLRLSRGGAVQAARIAPIPGNPGSC